MAIVSLQSIFAEADQAFQQGDLEAAIAKLHHILAYFPHLVDGHQLLGEAYLELDQPEPAAQAFVHALDGDPELAAAHYGLGLARQMLGQERQAITAFERAIELQSNQPELRERLQHFYVEHGGAQRQFRLSRAGLGRLYLRGGLFDQAVDEFLAVLATAPDRIDVRVALAEALWRAGRDDEALELCWKLIDEQPELLKPTLLLGYILVIEGRPEGETAWRRAATYDPRLTMAQSLFESLPEVQLAELTLPVPTDAVAEDERARGAAGAHTSLANDHPPRRPAARRPAASEATTQPQSNANEEDTLAARQRWVGETGNAASPDEELEVDEWELEEDYGWDLAEDDNVPQQAEAQPHARVAGPPLEDSFLDPTRLDRQPPEKGALGAEEAAPKPSRHLATIYAQLDAEPDNDALRLAVARMSWEAGDRAQSLKLYKQLIRRAALMDDVEDDLKEAIADAEDVELLRRLHRQLGDLYMKQQRLEQAKQAYSWTPAG